MDCAASAALALNGPQLAKIPPEGTMDNKKLLALARKNAAKSADIEKKRKKKTYDATLDVTRPPDAPDDSEADAIFREMKKREF
jgi:hypothetical protein